MRRSDPGRASTAVLFFQVVIPLGVLTAAAHVGANGGEDSVLPPAPAPAVSTPQPAATRSELQILALRLGDEPYAWSQPGRLIKSFITNSPETLEVIAAASLKGHPELDDQVRWTITPPTGFVVPAGARLEGGNLNVRLIRAGGNPTGGGGPLSLTVTAQVTYAGNSYQAGYTVGQDARDRLRQEYVDLERSYVPARKDLLDAEQFARAFGKKYPNVSFTEVNWSKQPGTEERYPVVMVTEELIRALQETRKQYGPLTISSCFRNPVRQVEVHASVSESHHQYGRAADLYVAPDSSPPKTGRTIATERDWLRLAAAALRGGGAWIEPMLACHVNTAGCHVHVDVRSGGSRSRIVRVTGKVTDPAGNPVAGAVVRMAGMPALTNERGNFALKHVVTAPEQELEIEAPGRAPVKRSIEVAGESAVAFVEVSRDPEPVMVARAAEAHREPGGAVRIQVALSNVGSKEARGINLQASGEGLPAAELTPAVLPSLGPGQETTVTLRLNPKGGDAADVRKELELALRLTALYASPTGAARSQTLPLRATCAAIPPPAEPKQGVVSGPPTPKAEPVASKSGPDLGVAAGGMVIGGAAAAAAALARRRARQDPPTPKAEPSVDPAQTAP